MINIPVIETSHLILRGHHPDDFVALKEIWEDLEVVKHISGTPSTEQQSWMRLVNYLGHWSLMGFGYWGIEEKSTGKYIGEIGFADFKREITPSITGIPEAGWILSSAVHGRGYGKEALKAILEWGDQNLSFNRTVCIINPENVRSISLAEKCGYQKVCETTFNGRPTILFERVKK
ncbi:GNAT family N-acetyltransferase [Bacteriovorax stolpii]|uniref:GNAT family N-acetyltransferase n=1 Tax=Bacteriovorax stolpii TaxID=960 RepID=UPI001159AEBA|nr:GNAT family N-acetyltransferase [Bacteriovorax stolpii]QDK40505.1 GNAT family N-acetyltransferase [Bacteriovorax stolpii]